MFTPTQKGWCGRQKQDVTCKFCSRVHVFLFTAHQQRRQPSWPNAVWLCFFISRYIKKKSGICLTLNPAKDLLMCCRNGSIRHYATFTRAWQGKVPSNSGGSHSDICVHVWKQLKWASGRPANGSLSPPAAIAGWVLTRPRVACLSNRKACVFWLMVLVLVHKKEQMKQMIF